VREVVKNYRLLMANLANFDMFGKDDIIK